MSHTGAFHNGSAGTVVGCGTDFTHPFPFAPKDEAASEENIRKRIHEAQPYFVLYLLEGAGSPPIAGFVNGTLTTAKELTHEAMYKHEPEGSKPF